MEAASDRGPDVAEGSAAALAARAGSTATTLAVLSLVALVADALLTGLTFAAMALWSAIYVAVLLPALGILTGLHALRRGDGSGARVDRGRDEAG
ncbi:MAG: hypothetical protein M3N17_02830 [Actinomycetota bacterium]|nr:hypothetical protein [Actinomycetota bacterium]